MSYIRQNHWIWHHTATTVMQYDLKPHEIIFVRGFMKANRWSLVTFTPSSERTPSTGTLTLNGYTSTSPVSSAESNWGPLQFPSSIIGGDTDNSTDHQPSSSSQFSDTPPATDEATPMPPCKQCIFLSYNSVRYRFGIRSLQAAAKPRKFDRDRQRGQGRAIRSCHEYSEGLEREANISNYLLVRPDLTYKQKRYWNVWCDPRSSLKH